MPAFSTADTNAMAALAMQSAAGTPNSTPAKFRFAKYVSGFNFNPDITVVDIREGGDGLDWGFTYKQKSLARGTLVVNFRSEIGGQILAAALGGATYVPSAAANPYAGHTFHGNHASFPYNTIQILHPGSDLQHLLSDVRFTGLTIEGNAGQPLRITAPFIAPVFGASAVSLGAPTFPPGPEDPFMYHVGPSYLVDGLPDSTIESWRIDLTLGVEELQAQSINLDEIAIQNRDANIQFVRRYQNSTLWKKIAYCGGITPSSGVASGSLRFVNQLPGVTGTELRYLEINVPAVTYRTNTLTELDPDGRTVRETVTGKALRHPSGAVWIHLRNNHASAYSS